ncbi:MAG TPA: hypothetical protein VGP83_16975 [Pyrinomonadaceae bacterium]|nr:hypothetical protein [Pyrinomonadaceae bacterium]
MKLIANTQLRGEYGSVAPDQPFEVRDETAQVLLRKNMARTAASPAVEYETKVITPEAPTVSARPPFRNLSVFNAQPEDVVAESHREFSDADLPQQPAPDPVRRAGRARRRSR